MESKKKKEQAISPNYPLYKKILLDIRVRDVEMTVYKQNI